jgi:hypothetical protein
VKLVLTILGGLMVLLGCVWVAQGLNVVQWLDEPA